MYRLGGACVRRRVVIGLLWVATVVVVAVVARAVGEDTNDNVNLPGSGAGNSLDLLDAEFPQQANQSNPIVLVPPQGKVTDAANKKVVQDTARSLNANHNVERAVSPLSGEGSSALSKDKRVAYISVTLTESATELTADDADSVIAATDPASKAGWKVAAGGYLGQEVSKPDPGKSDAIGVAAAVVILLFAFGTVVAMGLPIATAILGLALGLSVIALLSHAVDVPSVGPTLGTMIGLGVGIDYALFIVTRHRAHLEEGKDVGESVALTIATSGKAVAFAGTTVVIALLSLILAGIPIVSALGYSAAIVVVVAVAAALTLLPALLALLGRRVNSLRISALHERAGKGDEAHGWRRWALWISHRPWLALVASLAILLVLSIPFFSLRFGQPNNGQLPTSTQSRQSYDLLAKGFGPGTNGPLLIAMTLNPPAHPDHKKLNKVESQEQQVQTQLKQVNAQQQQVQAEEAAGLAPPGEAQKLAAQEQKLEASQKQLKQEKAQLDTPASDPRLTKLRNKVAKTSGVKEVSPPDVSKSAKAALLTVVPTAAPSSQAASDLVSELRASVIPDATKGAGITAYVGGQTAGYIDLASRISDKLVSVILIVIALSFVLLTLAFRSLVVPLKAALMNLLSIGAAYGVLVFVFQEGHGATLIGLGGNTPIVSYVPLLMFAILFGLSMDYEVFLMSQIRGHYLESGDNKGSVVEGLASTGRIITSAALIMVCVFSSFVVNGDPIVKEFGLGMAVAIAVDATVVRCMLVPAFMVLMRGANWWLPAWLDRRLPDIGIEG